MAIQEFPNLMGTRPEAKNEAFWREQWDEAHWMPGLCDPGQEASVALCLMHQSIAESAQERKMCAGIWPGTRLWRFSAQNLRQPKA